MKDLMQRVRSFILFDFPLDRNYISDQFATTHNLHQKEFPLWSTKATRQKLLASYWFFHVPGHFALLFGLPALLLLMTAPGDPGAYLAVVFIVGIITFLVLLLSQYYPSFYSNFLPQLETVKETYERKQLEQLEKCKRAQLSNPALVLIYYVFDKLSGINSLQCNDHYAALLMKLYGVDQGSLKKNLELIFGNKKNLSERKLTEIANRFQEAQDFFEQIHCKEGLKILGELERKFRVNNGNSCVVS